jgi:hypothetical protein
MFLKAEDALTAHGERSSDDPFAVFPNDIRSSA